MACGLSPLVAELQGTGDLKFRMEADSNELINCIKNGDFLPQISEVLVDILDIASSFKIFFCMDF